MSKSLGFPFLARALIAFLVLAGSSGFHCSQIQVLRTRELKKVEREVRALREKIEKMRAAMGSGFSEQLANVKEQEQSLNRMKADLQSLISRLEQQLSMVEGRMEESQKRLETIARKTEQIDSKEFIVKGAFASQAGDSGQKGSGVPRLIIKERAEIEKLFRLANEDFKAGKFELAREGFTSLLKEYPQNPLSDNSQYWIGECYYVTREYPKAFDEYRKVVDEYKAGGKTPGALFKMGLCMQKMNKPAQKRQWWDRLLKDFPSSTEAGLVLARRKGSP